MLPDSFMNLIRLKHLELSNCCDLTLSDQTLGIISTLERLNFSNCHKIEGLAPQVTHQPSLEELILDCTQLKELPSAIGDLRQLTSLSIMCCPIREVPFASVEKVQGGSRLLDSSIDMCMLRLNSLNLSNTRITEISFGEGVCPVLESLALERCNDLVEVGALPTTLTLLDLMDCCALKKITGLRGLAKLRYLYMSGCKEIEELPGLGVWELNNLENLNLQECPISVLPFASVEKVQGGRRFLDSSIDNCLLRLKSLSLSKTRITEISFGEGVCPVLESLYLAGCDDLVEVGALPTTLTSLYLTDCSALRKITGLRGLAKLRDLDMAGCYTVEELPGLETLISVEVLLTPECENMKRIRELAEAANPESDVLKKVIQLMERDEEN
uniref:Uncharacterized protein n=1 Tax=Picea sitchensis TaxID=3332 RepID=A9P1B3_PICSI|nr:unknown [Picea sitchensis]